MERTSELSGAPEGLFVDIPSMPAALLGEHSVGSLGELSHAQTKEGAPCECNPQ